MNCYLCEKTPLIGEVIEFLKDLSNEDRKEFLFDKENEAVAINEFIQNLKYSKTYCLRLDCGKIIAMGGFVKGVEDGQYLVWLLCTDDSKKFKKTIYKTVLNLINNFKYNMLIALVFRESKNHINFIKKALNFNAISEKGQLYVYLKDFLNNQ